jgi:hypothetical protein
MYNFGSTPGVIIPTAVVVFIDPRYVHFDNAVEG